MTEVPVGRLVLDEALDGAANMARDRALLDALEARLAAGERAPGVLRLYRWIRPTVSCGRHQALEAACDLPACLASGVDVVRRPTGGRAVLHADEITYAVIAPATGIFEGAGVERGSAAIAAAIARGLAALGAPAETVRGVARAAPRGVREACFVSASRSELVAGGRKLCGSAQLKGRSGMLQHGSLPLSFDADAQARALGTPAEVLRRKATGLAEVLGERPRPGDVIAALVRGFEEEWGIGLSPAGLDPEEERRAAAHAAAWRVDPERWRAAP